MSDARQRDDRCITTYMGKRFWPLDPVGCEVCIEDIAHALANTCRFNGHTRTFYSVAQHSVLVSRLVRPELALQGLLHDASEAYLHDIVRPFKRSVQIDGVSYAEYEDRLTQYIFGVFGVGYPIAKEVFEADDRVLATEQRDLMNQGGDGLHQVGAEPLGFTIDPANGDLAFFLFLQRFAFLYADKGSAVCG